jgi:hypothetical protein
MIAFRQPLLRPRAAFIVISSTAFLLHCAKSSSQETALPPGIGARSAYCIPIIQGDLENGRQLDAEIAKKLGTAASAQERALLTMTREKVRKMLADSESVLSRLQTSSFAPSQSDPVVLESARSRGTSDSIRSRTESKECAANCFKTAGFDGPKVVQCAKSCGDPELGSRLRACEKPDWLPPPDQPVDKQ